MLINFLHINRAQRVRPVSPALSLSRVHTIDHIHDNRHAGLDIIMQISHVVWQGANIKMMLGKSAELNSEVSEPKSNLRAKI